MYSVALVGMPGSGKTSVGRLLAEKLGLAFVDLDAVIAEEMGMPISKCFELFGEAAFRVRESEAMVRYLDAQCVLSLGGGAVLNRAAMNVIAKRMDVVYLRATADTLIKRLEHDETRPLLAGNLAAKIRVLLADRQRLYEAAATATIDTDGRSPEAIADTIVRELS